MLIKYSVSVWTPDEDVELLNLCSIHGTKWKIIAQSMAGKSETAVKNRYYGLKKRARVAIEEAKKFSISVATTGCGNLISQEDLRESKGDFESDNSELGISLKRSKVEDSEEFKGSDHESDRFIE